MNKLCCLIIMLMYCRICDAQIPDWEWARSASCYSNLSADEGMNVAADIHGNVYITGFFRDSSVTFGPFTLYNPNPAYFSVYIVKYDLSGNVLWAKNAGGSASAVSWGITTDVSGNVYVTGYFQSSYICFDLDTLANIGGGGNIFLVKYDAAGNVLWAKNAGGNSEGFSVTSDSYGNIYIVGDFSSPTIIFGSDTLTNSGGTDIVIAKYDSSGNVLWAKSVTGTSYDRSFSITSDTAGNTYLTGYFFPPGIIFGSDTLYNTGYKDFFIARYDSSGNALWAKSATCVNTDFGQCVAALSDGGVYAAGSFEAPSIIFDADTLLTTGTDGFLVKYDSLGGIIWAKSFTGGIPYNIVTDSINNIYIIGSMPFTITLDTITLQMPVNGWDALFIAKYNSSGHALWAKALASGGEDQGGISLGENGSIYIGGDYFFVNPFIIGNDTLILTCGESIFVAKLGYGSSVNVRENIKNERFIIYPNPFYDNLTISVTNGDVSEVVIYDITSRKLLHQTFINSTTINTAQLAKGIYLYEVRNKNGVIKKGKVVKD